MRWLAFRVRFTIAMLLPVGAVALFVAAALVAGPEEGSLRLVKGWKHLLAWAKEPLQETPVLSTPEIK
jgi:hypothetical protein